MDKTDPLSSGTDRQRTTETHKHTPGPWHLFPKNPLCIEAKDGNVALVNLARNSEADARLIAAAPDLLAVCRVAKQLLEPEVVKEPERTIFWELVRVIKKAEGRS